MKTWWLSIPFIGRVVAIFLAVLSVLAVSGHPLIQEHQPSKDVEITSCHGDGDGGKIAELIITNHSSGQSDYIVSLNFEDPSGVKLGEGVAISDNIDPGQSAIEEASIFQADGPGTCVVEEVHRTAS